MKSNTAIEEGSSELEWNSRMSGSIGHCKGNRKMIKSYDVPQWLHSRRILAGMVIGAHARLGVYMRKAQAW
jgi:hypothetical protein